MVSTRLLIPVLVTVLGATSIALSGDGNRLAYLEENNPYSPHAGFPKLTTPQWVGEVGVEAVVILAIDDMREPAKYEAFLRPILQRLKQIDGRAPVSIMTCNVQPDDPQLASWLGEGLSLEVHTVDHPCPLLQGGDFAKAKSTYDRCVDLLNEVPGNRPVAFRMPCCDSLNTVSPRFYAEIFGKTTPEGNFLQISSSVFNVFTKDDPEVPAELVTDPDGGEKFRKYLPKNLKRGDAVFNTFVNWIENYPYPYVIDRLCWEFPCMVPSDWEAQHLQQPNNPDTVRDMQAALDITVLKQGVFCLVFHPHGWIRSEQVVELIDHAVARHGSKVKFLTFREALGRLNENLLGGQTLRVDRWGENDGVQLVDLNGDGFMDVVHRPFKEERPTNRIWSAKTRKFEFTAFPAAWTYSSLAAMSEVDVEFGVVTSDGITSFLVKAAPTMPILGKPKDVYSGVWHFDDGSWTRDEAMTGSIKTLDVPLTSSRHGPGLRLLDVDGDGRCEIVTDTAIVHWRDGPWRPAGFALPDGISLRTTRSKETDVGSIESLAPSGLRFVDINIDGGLDVIFSNPDRYGIWLFKDMQTGWGIEVMSGKRGERPPDQELPPIVRADGSDNGFFVHSGHLFWQNEDTDTLPDLVDRRSFAELLKGVSVPDKR